MFAVRYWANRFFGARYWPPVGAAAVSSDRYFVGDGTSTDWETDANWHDADGGSYPGNAAKPTAANPVYFNASGTGNCALTANAAAASITIADGYTGNFDADTFNMAVGDFSGTKSTGSWDMGSGTWTCSGSWNHSGITSFVRGTATLNMTGTSKTLTWGDDLAVLTIAAGATVTAAGSLSTYDVQSNITINGSLSIPTGKTLRQVFSGTLTIGAAGVLTGAGAFLSVGPVPNVDNSAGGTVDIASFTSGIVSSSNRTATFVGNVDSATVVITSSAAIGVTHTRQMGDAAFSGNVTFSATGNGTLLIDNATNDPDLVFQGNVVRTPGTGAITWTKGDGTITLSGGGAQSVDFGFGQTIEDLIIDSAGGTVTLAGDIDADSFTGTAGTLDPAGYTVTTTGNCTWSNGFDFVADADAMDGCTWIVGGNFAADGQTLNATSTWTLTVTGTATATGVMVAYSDASGGTEIDASDGTCTEDPEGSCTNWLFVTAATAGPDYTFPNDRIHYTFPPDRRHYTLPADRKHHVFGKE